MTVWDTILVMKIKRRIVFKMKMERKNSCKIHLSSFVNKQPTSLIVDLSILNNTQPSLDVVGAKQNLLGHSDSITSICICQPYSVAVTTSKDRTAIIWDLNRYFKKLLKNLNEKIWMIWIISKKFLIFNYQ